MKRKENGKREIINKKSGISFIVFLIFIAMVVTSINACGYFGLFGEASWKEEVLLHDGSKIIVKRWQKFSTANTFDPNSLIKEQSISFKLPGKYRKIVWKDASTKDIWLSVNFTLIALHIKNNIPYLITSPYGCMAYNKWGRPNPAYVIFRYEGDNWKRIEFANLPPEFETVNLVINTISHKHKKEIGFWHRLITAEKVKALNKEGNKLEIFKTIVRTPYKQVGNDGCPEMVYIGNGWSGLGKFKNQESYEACFDVCKKIILDMHMQYCPCKSLFSNNVKGE